MGFNDRLGLAQLLLVQSPRGCEPNLGSKPIIRFAVGMGDVDMNARLFPREKEEPELTLTKNGWCHADTLHRANFEGERAL